MFNIHLVKRAKVVQVTDAHGDVYSVPLNSSIEFGLVYDPMESRGSDEALAGKFKLINKLLRPNWLISLYVAL